MKMDFQDFYGQMEKQLSDFEDAVNKIDKALDAGGTEAKEKVLPAVGDIKNLLTELKLQKEKLEKECPSDWSDDKAKMDDLVGQIGSHIHRAWMELPQGEVGG
jgi:hypothetical protein